MTQAAEIDQLDKLLAALDRAIGEVSTQAEMTHTAITNHSFGAYYDYRDSISQYDALVVTINHRKSSVPLSAQERITRYLLVRERRVLAVIIRATFDFFYALSAIPVLPIGIRELFAREINSLEVTKTRLRSPEHEGHLAPELQEDLELAQEILTEIMQKAPSLLNFDDAVGKKRHPRTIK
ncbi:MAG TPA: hypothetical protein VNT30_12860 [Stellaceae bacterium]|nr:hypothetical protein [Stellaceae bacterium]